MTGPSAVRIAVIFPELLGTYGDGGNATVLAQRLRWRGIPAEVVSVDIGTPVPTDCDVYLIGGGEDGPQTEVASHFVPGRGLSQAVESGAVVLAVCAGLQLLGNSLPGKDGPVDGLGILPCSTYRPAVGVPRAVGTVVADAEPDLNLPAIVGFENHASRTVLEPGARALGQCRLGHGNGVLGGGRAAADGVLLGRVIGTYLHGPVLALNPALADLLLEWVVGELKPLPDSGLSVAAAKARQLRLDQVH
jgi:CobQ-like glutamine amidotransferase family enzyme